MKRAIVVYRKNVYQVSPTALQAIIELTRRRVDSDLATGFILRNEGYDVTIDQMASTSLPNWPPASIRRSASSA